MSFNNAHVHESDPLFMITLIWKGIIRGEKLLPAAELFHFGDLTH